MRENWKQLVAFNQHTIWDMWPKTSYLHFWRVVSFEQKSVDLFPVSHPLVKLSNKLCKCSCANLHVKKFFLNIFTCLRLHIELNLKRSQTVKLQIRLRIEFSCAHDYLVISALLPRALVLLLASMVVFAVAGRKMAARKDWFWRASNCI